MSHKHDHHDHDHSHHHHHHHHHHHGDESNLKLAFFLNLAFTIIEIFGGFYTNSVAIISDAIHDLGDSLSLGTAWYLQRKSKQDSDGNFSYGYARFSLLGALITCVVLIIGSIFIIKESIERILHPEETNAEGMILFALLGVAVNGYAAWKLSSGKSMNEKLVSWHMVEDALGWVAVLIGGIILYFKDIPYLDPALSILIILYVLWNVIKNLKETLYLFLQGTPRNINIAKLENEIVSIPKIASTHQMHVWSMEGEKHVFSCHVKLEPLENLEDQKAIKEEIKAVLSKYAFAYVTIETELANESCVHEK